MSELSSAPRASLFTIFGTTFHVDPGSGDLRHGTLEERPENAVLVAEPGMEDGRHLVRIMHLAEGAYRPIACRVDGSGLVGGPQAGDAEGTLFELVPLERGIFGLRSGELYLCGEPDGRLTLSRPACSLWESFLASEDWCTAPRIGDMDPGVRRGDPSIGWRQIANVIVDPVLRSETRKTGSGKKFLVFGYTQWSHGRAYYDLCKLLHDRGHVMDILDWRSLHSAEKFAQLLSYYDFVVSALDGVQVLVDAYRVPYERIIALSLAEMDLYILLDQKGKDVFERFAAYGVVGFNIYVRSMLLGIAREPQVVPLGLDYAEFEAEPPARLTTVGYASSMTQKTIHGVEIKRGDLVAAAVRDAGLAFKMAGTGSTAHQINFHDIPAFYRSVDAIVMSSITEGDPLTVREAAAAGRLVIGTPAGHFPIRAYGGGGIIAPIEREKFKAFVTAALIYYKENPAAYVAICRDIREAARQFDWQYAIGAWMELLDSANPPV